MKKSTIVMLATFLFAVGTALATKANNTFYLLNQGYAAPSCTLANLDQQNQGCAVQAGPSCTIMGVQAFDSPADCAGQAIGQLNLPQ
jgi:hypothetical protein